MFGLPLIRSAWVRDYSQDFWAHSSVKDTQRSSR